MGWDKLKPAGGEGLNVGDDGIRENQRWLEAALAVSLDFPGSPGTVGRPKIRRGTKAQRDAIILPQEGEFFVRTDVSPGALDLYHSGAWRRQAGPQVGDIQLYFGDPSNVAADRPGWALCDGSIANGFTTPDLRSRFVVGYNSADVDYDAIGETGPAGLDLAAKTITLTLAQLPVHDHGAVVGANLSGSLATVGSIRDSGSNPGGVQAAPTHTHTISSEGGDGAHENRPPYHTVAYIVFVEVP